MRTVKVWIFNHHAAIPAIGGSTRHFDCGRRLAQRGWQVTVFAGLSDERTRSLVSASMITDQSRTTVFDGVRFIWIDTPSYRANDLRRGRSMLSFARSARRVARQHLAGTSAGAPSPDVVIGSSVHPFAALAAQRVAQELGVPFVLELRDLWPQSLIEMGVLHPLHPISAGLRALETFLVRRASKIIVLSDRALEYFVRRGVDSERMALIPNGIDLGAFGEATPQPEAEPPLKLMYLGAHGVANRLTDVLKAARLLADRGKVDVAFELVGEGKAKEDLRAMAAELGLARFRFLPGVPKSEVPRTLARADAFILTEANNVYGSSNKLSDYLAAGRPILFSTYAHHNVASACGIISDPRDPAALADAIEALADASWEERQIMGRAGRRLAERTRSWELLAEEYAEVLAASRLAS